MSDNSSEILCVRDSIDSLTIQLKLTNEWLANISGLIGGFLNEMKAKASVSLPVVSVGAEELPMTEVADQKKTKRGKPGLFLKEEVEYEDRTYENFSTCKYGCGHLSAWATDYKKGDRKLHMNPTTREIIGFECPAFEEEQ